MSYKEYDVEKLREIPIVDICSSYNIELKKKGHNLWGTIRNEKTPSFSVNPEKNIWRDWGISKGGDGISLIAELEHIEYGQAIQVLGNRFNIESNGNNSYFPSKSQFAEIGIVSDRAMSNFDIDLENQSLEKLQELDEKYSISMNELSKVNISLYHKLVDKKALPKINTERNLFIDFAKKYMNENSPLEKELYQRSLQDLENRINKKISIYNSARLDDVTLNELRVSIEDVMNGKEYESMGNQFNIQFSKDLDLTDIMENLKNGVGNIFTNENFIKYLDFQSNFYTYSANNNLLIALQNPNATMVASFAKWKSLGRAVNKGEKGIMILAPNVNTHGANRILELIDYKGNLKVGKYNFKKVDNTYNILIKNIVLKSNLTRKEMESFLKVNNIKIQEISGFRKAYVFDISQTNGKEIPQFKVNQLKDTDLVDSNGFYKNPLIKVKLSEGNIFNQEQTITFRQANEVYERKENEIRELRKQHEAKGEYYPYMKQKLDMVLVPNSSNYGIKKDIRVDIGDGEYNNLFEALKGEMKGYPQIFATLEESLKSSDKSMETILAIKNQIENCINTKGITLDYETDTGEANGYFSPSENKICVKPNISLSQSTKTLLHEYVHSQLHKDGVKSKDSLADRQVAEIEAESTTYVVAKHFGFDTSDYSFDYVSTWARGKEISTLEETLKSIKTSAEKIINEIKAPLELELYNNRETINEILKSENIKPNDKIINNMIDINKATGKINTVSDLNNAEKYKAYDNDKSLSKKITETNKEINDSPVIIEKTTKIEIEMER